MAYTKTNWVNGETPINANNLNKIENQLETNTADIASIDDKLNYSTTEQVVGTWTDGKPIYRKVKYFNKATMIQTTWTPIIEVNNVETLIRGTMGLNDIVTTPPEYIYPAVWNDVQYRYNNDAVEYYASLTHITNWVMVEYTKTTD